MTREEEREPKLLVGDEHGSLVGSEKLLTVKELRKEVLTGL